MYIYRIEHVECSHGVDAVSHHGPVGGYCNSDSPKFGSSGPCPQNDPWRDYRGDDCQDCEGTGTRMGFEFDYESPLIEIRFDDGTDDTYWDYPKVESVFDCYTCNGTGKKIPTIGIRYHERCAVTEDQLHHWWSYPENDARRELGNGWKIVKYLVNFWDIKIGVRQTVFDPNKAVVVDYIDSGEHFIDTVNDALMAYREIY